MSKNKKLFLPVLIIFFIFFLIYLLPIILQYNSYGVYFKSNYYTNNIAYIENWEDLKSHIRFESIKNVNLSKNPFIHFFLVSYFFQKICKFLIKK